MIFFILILLLFNYEKSHNRSTKKNSFSKLIPSAKEQEYNPGINTNNWNLHKIRLNKFGRSQYKGLTFFISLEYKFTTFQINELKSTVNIRN